MTIRICLKVGKIMWQKSAGSIKKFPLHIKNVLFSFPIIYELLYKRDEEFMKIEYYMDLVMKMKKSII